MSGRCALHIPALISCWRCGEVGLFWWTCRFLYHVRYRKAEIQYNRYLKKNCDGPAGRKRQSSSLQHCSAAGAGQHVDRLLLLIISLPFLPKSNNPLAIILLFRRACRIAAEERLQESEKEQILEQLLSDVFLCFPVDGKEESAAAFHRGAHSSCAR